MSRRSSTGPKLELKPNLSPPRVHNPMVADIPSPTRSESPTSNSPASSCVSAEMDNYNLSSTPETTSMVLVGCPRCLMYVMLSEDDPKCPKCKSTVLLDFLHETNNNSSCYYSGNGGGGRKGNGGRKRS